MRRREEGGCAQRKKRSVKKEEEVDKIEGMEATAGERVSHEYGEKVKRRVRGE